MWTPGQYCFFVLACLRVLATRPEGVPVHLCTTALLTADRGLDSLGHLPVAASPRSGAGCGSGGLAGSRGREY